MVAFHDRNPAAETHILIISLEHISSVKTVQPHHLELLLRIKLKALELLMDHGHDPGDPTQARLGFHVPPYNTVDHLHLHVLGGEFKSAYRNTKYEKGRKWYLDLEDLFTRLRMKSSIQE
ncbi:Histidine triad nucleotide-binding protein 3 [Gryganskiella cystojenkinii]|nr:Histidine triad nucleotide-binding protein 3 [Gryganskiella cystojenkinii]